MPRNSKIVKYFQSSAKNQEIRFQEPVRFVIDDTIYIKNMSTGFFNIFKSVCRQPVDTATYLIIIY